ncbi:MULTISPECIES: hypothetical protein [Methylobacterium]|uniref:Uncharacterized protein n=1 Tax=Methylobacterium thuringiense TaxID=1003091 RepID=A0ABQ4TQP2_9HYPH|nr:MULTISPECIES: hypothetical protein [Methylobacterium]TXN24106.1 hypothetical protein FV217_03885 [Methylobacterium sp. WL9]GJE56355.1 hypothetical protein EKPJFOCH_2857 [Methylobacterium thuringiense]
MSRLILAASILAMTCAASGPASALSASECSVKYQAAKKDGSLGATKWNDFRKAQCGADAQPAAATTTTAPAPAPTEAAKPAPTQTAAKPEPTAKPTTPAASGSAVFPSKIDPKYASESAGKQRQKTCLDQYNVNKANGGNGGLNWIMKGGGYYSECNKRLKV